MTTLLYTSAMAMQFVNSQTPAMNLSRLHSEVNNGTYIFKRPLTIINCAAQENTSSTHLVSIVSKVCNRMVMATIDPFTNGSVFPCTGSPCVSYCPTGRGGRCGQSFSMNWRQKYWVQCQHLHQYDVKRRPFHHPGFPQNLFLVAIEKWNPSLLIQNH